MVYVLRVALALLLLSASHIVAAFPASFSPAGTEYRVMTFGPWASSPEAACSAASHPAGGNYSLVWVTSGYPTGCVTHVGGVNVGQVLNLTTREKPAEYSCPANATLSGSSCSCNQGYNENAGSCTAPNNQQNCTDAALAGSSAFGQQPVIAPLASGTSLCIANEANSAGVGCKVDILDPAVLVQPDGRRYVRGFPRRTNTGADTCPTGGAGDPATPKTEQDVKDAPKACKGGQQATMNGVTVCQPLPSGTSVTTPKTTTTTSSTGGGVDGNSPTVTSASGQVQCVGGQCTTTTTTTKTTTNPDGSTTTTSSTSSKTESEGDYCRENPKAQQCEEGSWGGSCSAGFACDGDAVMCAIAQDQHKRNCTLFDNATPQSQLFDTEKNKTGSQVENENKSIGAGSFDTSDALGGGSCIGDKQVTVMGWTGSLPFSLVCAQLAILGNVLLVVSFLLAGRIVVRG
jgi:hypothetical protein